jgi:HEAT repeat protein
VRSAALEVLARTWPQERSVRELVEQRAIRDEDGTVRGRALRALARSWLQEHSVLELIEQRALQDKDCSVRFSALMALARTWPQEQSVRELVEQRALQDQDGNVRAVAMGELVRIWPRNPATQDLMRRALLDGNPVVRCAALGGVLQIATDRVARLILSRDLDGLSPFLDPRKPISLRHRQNAASQLAVTTSEVDERLSSYSKALGWNLSKGVGRPRPRRS